MICSNDWATHFNGTPITELRTLTEVAARWPSDQSTTAAYFRDAHDIALKMESLIEMLLTLARTQAQPISISNEQINLVEAVHAARQSYDAEILRKNLNPSCTISDAQMICTDKLVFTRILQNLLANAVEYTPKNGSIEIAAEPIDGACVLRISNTNDSIAAEDLPRLFESFWRKDAARSDGRHTGLGLTLVSEYAKHLHIKIEPHLPRPDRFEISLWIPGTPATTRETNAGHLPIMLTADNPLPRRRESDADVAHT
jgi:signal transduction histidine kinase